MLENFHPNNTTEKLSFDDKTNVNNTLIENNLAELKQTSVGSDS